MSLASCPPVPIIELSGWNTFFAKEPASSDPNQPDMDKTVVLGPPGKKGPTPPTMKERILFLVLILIIVGTGGYLAVNPEMLMTLLGDAPGQTPPPQIATPNIPKPAAPAPASTPAPAPVGSMPAPVPGAVPAAPAVPVAPAAVAKAPMPAATIPSPKFGEGQKVSVSTPTPLTADSAGKQPGKATAVPGSTLVVLDADLQNLAWVYSVRTDKGATGWVAEKNLVAK